MSDTKTVTLPVSKQEVVLRNYTTRADDAAVENILYDGVFADATGDVKMPALNAVRKQDAYVQRLVKMINGQEATTVLLEDLRTKDYLFLKAEVEKIVEENSPKE